VGGLLGAAAPPTSSRPVDWKSLFAAAGLDASAFADSGVERRPVVTSDEIRAWQGRPGGREVRVDAGAYRGRAVHWLVSPGDRETRPPARPEVRSGTGWLLDTFTPLVLWSCIGVLALLARRNLRLGRGDRRGANRLAVAVFAGQALYAVSERHWSADPLVALAPWYVLGQPLYLAAETWLLYLGLEPYVRRRWPRFLIAWSRLVEGRWRDPLVGRTLLVGTAAALVAVGVVPGILSSMARAFSLPVSVPRYAAGSLDGGFAWFLGAEYSGQMGVIPALFGIAVLLVLRLALRRDLPAYAAWFLSGFALFSWQTLYAEPWALAAPSGPLIITALVAGGGAVLMLKEGVLAAAVFYTVVAAVQKTPLTCDPTRWYAWRTGVVIVLMAALLFWGFRNVLGRQSAFPEATLDG
jgi:hypothetical protein